jgi:hypothetical protein
MPEDLLQGGKADAGAKHSRGEGMSQLVRPNGRTTGPLRGILKCLMYLGVIHGLSVREQE